MKVKKISVKAETHDGKTLLSTAIKKVNIVFTNGDVQDYEIGTEEEERSENFEEALKRGDDAENNPLPVNKHGFEIVTTEAE